MALVGDLHLGDLVDRLAERLAPVRAASRLHAHQHEPEEDRDSAEEQVGDGLVDREVERPKVDRHPLVQRPLGGRVELLLLAAGLRRRERNHRQREEQDGAEPEQPLHAFASEPKNVISETASSSVYASA
jgi:hypothetical protein